MSEVTYYLKFGSGEPSNNTGLSPSFTVFQNVAGGATTAPGITEIASTGIYYFQYEPFGSISFVADGVSASLSSADRYIVGSLEESDRTQQSVGLLSDVIGDNSTDPSTLFGYIKRIKNWLEGDTIYNKTTGNLSTYDVSGVTQLGSQTISSSGSTVSKT